MLNYVILQNYVFTCMLEETTNKLILEYCTVILRTMEKQ